MNLYLVQHGQAVPKEVDPDRPLSDQGWEDIQKTAAFASRAGVSVDTVWHSGKTRARQTAQALAEALESRRGPEQAEGLKPLDDPSIWTKKLSDLQEDTVLVGHLPHLSRLASLLLTGESEAEIVAFQMTGIVCLGRADRGSWSLRWMVIPRVLG